jgi:hypothetical protein
MPYWTAKLLRKQLEKKFIFALYPCFELHRSQTISAMNKTNKILGSFIRVLLLKIQNNNLEPWRDVQKKKQDIVV